MSKIVKCKISNRPSKLLFEKKSPSDGRSYHIFRSPQYNFWQIDPIPTEEELNALYQNEYFKKRSDRGYNNYASVEVKRSIQSTFLKNLQDLDFFHWNSQLGARKFSLDVGCAAGYFVEFMQEQGWQSFGSDVAREMIETGRKNRLMVFDVNFLDAGFLGKLGLTSDHKFDLITLWATIEHLPNFDDFLKQMRKLLSPDGRVYLSTCHLGFWARIYGRHWRYLNVPEHIWYFGYDALEEIAARNGFKIHKSFTYGSGFTAKKKANRFSQLIYDGLKKMADYSAKFFHLGDMIVVELRNDRLPK